MGHYASEMGWGGPSEWELKIEKKLSRARERLAKTPMSAFTADYAFDLVVVNDPAWRDRKFATDESVDRILAFFEKQDSERSIGTTIRDARMAKRWTLRAFAEKLGVSAPYISDVEHGRRKLSVEKRVRAMELLGL